MTPSLAYRLDCTSTGPTVEGRCQFPPGFPGFDGHFPGDPILPGFLHIQTALDLLHLAAAVPAAAALAGVENAKFTRPIRPHEEVTIRLTPAGPLEFDAELAVAGGGGGGGVCSRFRLSLGQESAAVQR
jgi:3-hydroxymyristoyl/3-hydroxydecanoyl-(acyl carrier protein) dehydratase